MFRKRILAAFMVAMITVSVTACGNDAVSTNSNAKSQGTTVAVTPTTQQQTTKSAEVIAQEKSKEEEISKKAEEAKASMAAEVEKASKEAESKAAAAKAEAESKAAATQAATTEAPKATEAPKDTAAAKPAADDEVVTVVDSYGVESARKQYAANYDIYVELVKLTNQLRASLGVAPLRMEENICIASCKKAVDYHVANYYDGPNHSMIDGRHWRTLFEDFNIQCSSKSENLAKGPAYKTAQQMFEGWKNSPVHYENMVNPAYSRVGVGSCGYVWFMDLASDN